MSFFAFLDRDGTLIEEKNYLSDPDGVVMIPGGAAAICRLQAAGAKVVVISNQAGVGRGYFGVDAVHAVNQRIQALLQSDGCRIDAFYFCPHHPDDGCECRKPRLGLFQQAAADFDMPLSGVMIGDNASDIQAGIAAGLTTILVRTGYGERTAASQELVPHYVAADLAEAVDWYLAHWRSSTVER